MIDNIGVILWDMQLLQELLYTGNEINHFIIHKAHHVWFDKQNYRLSIEYKHTTGSILLWQDPEGHIHDSDLLNLITCKLDFKSTPFSDETIITYEIELLPSGNKIGFNLLNDEDFKIPYITDTIPN